MHSVPRQQPSSDWWATYFDAHYLLEFQPVFSPARDREEVARLIDLLALPSGARILDVPCGQGRHAHLLADAGFRVDGLDYSRHLIDLAKVRGTGPGLRYVVGDMRRMSERWTGRFDAVVCDIRMPKLSGISFLNNLRLTAQSTCRVVMLSSLNDRAIQREALAAGAVAYLVKPASSKAIIDAVSGAVAAKR